MACSKVHSVSEMAAGPSDDAPSSRPSCPTSSKRESFTVWMKSLIMQGNGCTVFNENGEVVYRMDNYDTRRSRKFYLMDLRGRVVFSIVKRKLWVFGCWEGYDSGNSTRLIVRKNRSFLKTSLFCKVEVFYGENKTSRYTIQGFTNKSEFDIKDCTGATVAEVRRKQTASGGYLGDDVLALVVEPPADHSLIVALVAVYGSIRHRM